MIYEPKKSLIQLPSLWLPGSRRRPLSYPPSSRGMPGYPCCCEKECELFSDDFNRANSSDLGSDWTEDAGDWSILSNKLHVASSNAVAVTTESFDLPLSITVEWTATTVDDEMRIIFNYTDTNNYNYVQLHAETFFAVLTIYTRSGGSDTLVKSKNVLAADFGDLILLRVCITSTKVAVAIGVDGGELSGEMNEEVSSSSSSVGVGTGTITTSVDVDNFDVRRHATDTTTNETCSSCAEVCTHCIDDLTPEILQVVISGITPDNGPNGTYILTPQIIAACAWTSVIKTYQVWNTCGATDNVVLIQVGSPGISLGIFDTGTECVTGGSFPLATHNETGDEDCMNWDNLELTSLGANGDFHDVSGAQYFLTTIL